LSNRMRFSSRVFAAAAPHAGKTALVTASTDGIGLAIARRLAQDGAKVWISSRKADNVTARIDELRAEGLNVDGMVCHVGDAKDRQALISAVMDTDKRMDILVSNAAANPYFGPILLTPEKAWDKIFDVNVKNTFQLIQECVPHLEEAPNKSSITCISSIAGFQPMPMLGAYSVSKTALLGLCRVLSQELAAMDIRVNCVCPGVVKTKFAGAILEMEEELSGQFSMKRFAEPHEISGIVSFLADEDRASYITGENFTVCGGGNFRL